MYLSPTIIKEVGYLNKQHTNINKLRAEVDIKNK